MSTSDHAYITLTEPANGVSKKKILLVSPDSGVIATERQYFAPPLGVMRLQGYLNAKGHDADYYDPNLFACNGLGPSLLDKIQEQDWDIIGFSVLDETLAQDILNIYEAHKNCPNALLIAGGVEAQFNYQTLLDKTPCRIIVLGEGELPLLEIANEVSWQNIPGIVIKNLAVAMSQELFNEATQTIHWETINYEAYWDVYQSMYGDKWTKEIEAEVKTVRIFARNRCPIGCKFCSSTFQLTLATGGKVPVISTTEENLISVIDRVVESHPEVKMIYLTDDDFVINKLSVIKLCKQIIERDFGDLSFMCFARITDLTDEVMEWMSKANFNKLNIGVESFSQAVLDEVGKRCEVDRIHVTLKALKKYGIRPFCNIILTTPKSTMDDVEVTLDGILQYMQDDFYMAGMAPAIRPSKGTEFFEMYWDFKSHIMPIEGTDLFLRKDDYIYALDPLVREFQIRFIEGVDAAVDRYIEEQDIRHPNQATLSPMKFLYAKRLLAEIREEAASGNLKKSSENTPGAGRLYPETRRNRPIHPYGNNTESGVATTTIPDIANGWDRTT